MRGSLFRSVTQGVAWIALVSVALGYLTGCVPPGTMNQTSTPVGSATPVPTSLTMQPRNDIDTLVEQVLDNMHLHAWNPHALTHGVLTGGLYINWRMSDPDSTNYTRPGPTGDAQQAHDPQVDLLYLVNLAEHQQLHPKSHLYEEDLRRTGRLVLLDFQRYSLPKGWIYFYLLKCSQFLHNAALLREAQTMVSNLYKTWYDPALGFVYDRVHTPADYTSNDSLESGAALIEAGLRWHQSAWVVAGKKTLDHLLTTAFDPHYHLFYDSLIVGSNGHDQIKDRKARPSTEGEAISALVVAYTLTHDQRYLDVAGLVLHSLFETSGLWDAMRGGFFFALRLDTGQVISDYKETRSQSLILIGLHLYNQVAPRPLTEKEQQLINVLTGPFYQISYHGFVYRLTPAFQIYVSKPGAGIGIEDYVTTEAMSISLDALQQTELPVS